MHYIGSGIISKNSNFSKPYKILSVRGPYTKERCLKIGYDCPEICGDPAILMSRYYYPKYEKKYKLGIIPHFAEYSVFSENKTCNADNDVLIIDVRHPIAQIVDQILACECVVSSSLHGIILRHAYNIPVGWASFGNKLNGDGVKFHDHFASLNCFDVECLGNAHNYSLGDLIKFAKSAPVLDVSVASYNIFSVCPFKMVT